jgi:hypothetical protein
MQQQNPSGTTMLQRFEPAPDEVSSIETVAHLTQTPRHQIAVYYRHGLISPVAAPGQDGWWFDLEAVRELRRIGRLRIDYDRVISGLFREVERLREEVRELRRT